MTEDLVFQALAALKQKDFATAQNRMRDFAAEYPMEMQHYLILGLSELALKNWIAARNTFEEAVKEFPHQPQLWSNLGSAQENLNELSDAAESYEHSLNLKTDQGETYGNLSNTYRRLGLFIKAEAMAHKAYECGAPKAQALNSLGLALRMQGKYDIAAKTFQDALALEPSNAQVIGNLAELAVDQLKFDKAWPLFAAARAIDDNAVIRRDEGIARLQAGDYAKGWPLYEARLELPGTLRIQPPCPRYNGQDVSGKKILLIAEQGYGDTIMFCRYGRIFAERSADVLWAVQKPLQRLLADNLPGVIFNETDALPVADYYLPLLSLPLMTGKLLPAETPTVPYLRAANGPALPHAKEDRRKIGLVWSGSATHERDHERSIPLDEFIPLLKNVKARYYAPVIGAALGDIGEMPITQLDRYIDDFADTAALIVQLDTLITVDTSTAHLAGALGVKTYLLLPYCCDWRWGTKSSATPWYPSVTVLRQKTYDDWQSVIAGLADDLA